VTKNSSNAAITSSQVRKMKSCGQNTIPRMKNLRAGRSNKTACRSPQEIQGSR
jgi:hypothetical protein